MPYWLLLTLLAAAGWLGLSLVGGFAIGRFLALGARRSRKRAVV